MNDRLAPRIRILLGSSIAIGPGKATTKAHRERLFGKSIAGVKGNEMEIVKSVIALVPASLLLCGSVALFRTAQSMWVSFQLIGSLFFLIVVFAHMCEALGILNWMHWGS